MDDDELLLAPAGAGCLLTVGGTAALFSPSCCCCCLCCCPFIMATWAAHCQHRHTHICTHCVLLCAFSPWLFLFPSCHSFCRIIIILLQLQTAQCLCLSLCDAAVFAWRDVSRIFCFSPSLYHFSPSIVKCHCLDSRSLYLSIFVYAFGAFIYPTRLCKNVTT